MKCVVRKVNFLLELHCLLSSRTVLVTVSNAETVLLPPLILKKVAILCGALPPWFIVNVEIQESSQTKEMDPVEASWWAMGLGRFTENIAKSSCAGFLSTLGIGLQFIWQGEWEQQFSYSIGKMAFRLSLQIGYQTGTFSPLLKF